MKCFAVFLTIAAVMMVALSGCGGGGGGGGGKEGVRSVWGVANIHHDSLHPRVEFLTFDDYSNPIIAGSSVTLSRPASGWSDESFGLPAPPNPGVNTVYSVAAFNDTNSSGEYETSELLGFADSFLVWNAGVGKWQIWDKATSTVRWDDAFAHTGRANIFIDATCTRADSEADKLAAEKAAVAAFRARL